MTAFDKGYRTRLRLAAKREANFAGHYVLAAWGCGTDCLNFAIIDRRTGQVFRSDEMNSVGPPGMDRLTFQPDSKLLIVTAGRSEEEYDRPGVRFYAWDGRKLKLVRSYPYAAVCEPDRPPN